LRATKRALAAGQTSVAVIMFDTAGPALLLDEMPLGIQGAKKKRSHTPRFLFSFPSNYFRIALSEMPPSSC
jgi:hypothetical protein